MQILSDPLIMDGGLGTNTLGRAEPIPAREPEQKKQKRPCHFVDLTDRRYALCGFRFKEYSIPSELPGSKCHPSKECAARGCHVCEECLRINALIERHGGK